MITEDYVSFETAKLLKEKGFNEDSWFHYDTNGDIVTRGYRLNHPDDIPAWTHQMAMKWLREVHKINISIMHFIGFWTFGIDINDIPKIIEMVKYDKYEEACEAAIKYCLENLI